ncbi:MAG TPA: aminotransferase class I/II-fold pyridoxal phosphate-dependent enzyme [Candidatus Eremiobacteraceae bacterium]|nr:aminotransferase class I/II-fold pyridoxal phosphate-dependent enzyme [Candidatus Eremiobacteraceae bacterium]
MPTDFSLELDADVAKRLGHELIEAIVDYRRTMQTLPALRRASHAALAPRLCEPLPRTGKDPFDVVRRVMDDVLPYMGRADHPRYFAFIPGPSNIAGVFADLMISGYNVFAGTWLEGSGPAVIESTTIRWLADLAGMPPTAGGLFVSGGSIANLTALHAAREARLAPDQRRHAVIYFSDQTHSSIDRGLRILGFVPDQMRRVASTEAFALDVGALQRAISADRAAGRLPFCLISNAGTTNTGAVDPLDSLSDLCAEEGLWHHVDGAFGAGAIFSAFGRALLAGLGRVDSFSVDPHKWIFQPYPCGCLIVRDPALLRRAFSIVPEYLTDAHVDEGETNYWEFGPELTRPFRALKLWMSLQVFGADAFGAAVDRGFELAALAEREVRRFRGWQICSPASMGVVTFRYCPDGMDAGTADDLNRRMALALTENGYAAIVTTKLAGRVVIRMCTLNPRTTDDDIRGTISRLHDLAQSMG